MKVNYKSRVLTIIQKLKQDERYFAFKDLHDGLSAAIDTIHSIKVNHERPRGSADGVNKNFRVDNEPSFLTVDGIVKIPGVDYSVFNGLIIFKSAPVLNAVVRSHFI